MILRLLIILGVFFIIFLGYVATRSGKFRYERSGLIKAPASKIFPYISNFKRGEAWSPYEKVDPSMKKIFTGVDGQVGSIMEFEGNRDVGSGQLEMLKVVPNELVEIKLTMIKPISGENWVQYKLTTEGADTRFTWTMSGDGGFLSKLMTVLIDCEKMIGDQFSQGIENLKSVVESEK